MKTYRFLLLAVCSILVDVAIAVALPCDTKVETNSNKEPSGCNLSAQIGQNDDARYALRTQRSENNISSINYSNDTVDQINNSNQETFQMNNTPVGYNSQNPNIVNPTFLSR